MENMNSEVRNIK